MADYNLYQPVEWTDTPETPTNAYNLNLMDEGIRMACNGDNTPVFTNYDSVEDTEETPLEYVEVEPLEEGEQTSSILIKISKMFRNVRFLKKKNDILGSFIYGNEISKSTTNSWTENARLTFEEGGVYLVFAVGAISNAANKSITFSLTANGKGSTPVLNGRDRQSLYANDNNTYSASLSNVCAVNSGDYVSLASWSAGLTTVGEVRVYAMRIK